MVGLLGGLAVSTFSRTLAFLFGLMVFGVQVRLEPSSSGRILGDLTESISVRGIEGIEYSTNDKAPEIYQGY